MRAVILIEMDLDVNCISLHCYTCGVIAVKSRLHNRAASHRLQRENDLLLPWTVHSPVPSVRKCGTENHFIFFAAVGAHSVASSPVPVQLIS